MLQVVDLDCHIDLVDDWLLLFPPPFAILVEITELALVDVLLKLLFQFVCERQDWDCIAQPVVVVHCNPVQTFLPEPLAMLG